MEWVYQVQFIAAVPMPEALADGLGTTINGMCASPERYPAQVVAEAHTQGKRVLFSVPLIALTPQVYEQDEHRHLIEEACRDIEGNPSLVPWYYWEKKPVYSMCIYSEPFRDYLLDRCRDGINRGMDVVNLDEINTSVGLMNRKPGGSGFCHRCLARFRRHLATEAGDHDGDLVRASDEFLRKRLADDESLFLRYRRFHELEAFRVILDVIQELRFYARPRNPEFAISANVAYLGNLVKENGDLWGPMWGEYLDFVLMENIYQPDRRKPHLLLPRGKFTAWYRLGSAFTSRAPAWICPSIQVPRQLAGQKRTQYYLLMFLEAYANGGRWGYYWWPGVDVETRMKATVPERLKDYIHFITRYRDFYEGVSTQNRLAILYLDGGMLKRPDAHFKYVALAQALAEAGYQYDVIYAGDGVYASDDLDVERLKRYKALLVPESNHLTEIQAEKLAGVLAGDACQLIFFTKDQPDPRLAQAMAIDERLLFRFWMEYREEDRENIAASVSRYVSERILTSDPLVNGIRYVKDGKLIIHLINYNYDAGQDQVIPVENLSVQIPWEGSKDPDLRWLSLDGEQNIPCRVESGKAVWMIPKLDMYGMAILQ